MNGRREKSKAELDSESQQEYELSEEAKIGADEKKHIKELEDGRTVVSREPFEKDEEDFPEESEEAREKKNLGETKTTKPEETKTGEPEDLAKEIEEEEKREIGAAESQPRATEQTNERIDLDTSKLVNLLASYGVPLDSSVRELLQEINRKGERHLQRELSKRLGRE